MLKVQFPYYQLFQSLQEQGENRLSSELLENWLKENPDEIAWIRKLSNYQLEDWKTSHSDELCRIYALGRINELCLYKLDKLKADQSSLFSSCFQSYLHFFQNLGLQIREENPFHPFFHEIVEIAESDSHTQINLREVLYPALMIGKSVFSRARVSAFLPQDSYDLHCLKTSTLFWAYRRANRKTQDLSYGWGSNSQWRTEMRIDVETEEKYHYNLRGGNIDLNQLQGNHKKSLIDFLRFRHILVPMDEEEYFIYEYGYEEEK
ncbi:MAG: hypothetical protein AAF696_35010 [Bacteroidota bacterium]